MTTTIAVPVFRLDLGLKQGAGAVITLTTVDKDGNVITDPTGHVVRAQIREMPHGPVLFEWNSNPTASQGSAVLTYAPGTPGVSTVILSYTDEHTLPWRFTLAKWDCFLTNPLGETACLAAGVVRLEPFITH